MFALEGPTSAMLQPATKKDLLAALLAVLRDTSWAHAVRCPAEPAFMTPISCSTALDPTRLPSEVRGCQPWPSIVVPCAVLFGLCPAAGSARDTSLAHAVPQSPHLLMQSTAPLLWTPPDYRAWCGSGGSPRHL